MKLPRPPIPLHVQLRVAMRQLGAWTAEGIDAVVAGARRDRDVGRQLEAALAALAQRFGCAVADLALDHDPALANREKLVELAKANTGRKVRCVVPPKGARVIRYFPDANDPEHLAFRPQPTDADASHAVKTRVRGDHGQLSDLALLRKNKKIEARIAGTKKAVGRFPRGRKLQGRGFAKVHRPMRRAP